MGAGIWVMRSSKFLCKLRANLLSLMGTYEYISMLQVYTLVIIKYVPVSC